MSRPMPVLLSALLLTVAACTVAYHRDDDTSALPESEVRPGISVLLTDSLGLIKDKRLALLTNQTGVDPKGEADANLLLTSVRADSVKAKLVLLFSPEHGLSGIEDRMNIPSAKDSSTGLPVYSLYTRQTVPPPDSAIARVDAVLIDLQDVGARTWTYEGAMVYTMRAAAKQHKTVIILDRPNPLTGSIVEGPMLDSSLANPDDPTPQRPGIAYALYPIPMRHGMTMGELARFYNAVLNINADLHVVPAYGWRRELWYDRTKLPFVPPSPNLPTFQSVMLYPGLVPLEATNLSVGRGTLTPFQVVGAPWLNPTAMIRALREQGVLGVRFTPTTFIPSAASDKKYNDQVVRGIQLTITSRSALQTSRLAAALVAALHRVHPKEFEMDTLRFDRLFGSRAARRSLMKGGDPDSVIDQEYSPAYAFREKVKRFLLY